MLQISKSDKDGVDTLKIEAFLANLSRFLFQHHPDEKKNHLLKNFTEERKEV